MFLRAHLFIDVVLGVLFFSTSRLRFAAQASQGTVPIIVKTWQSLILYSLTMTLCSMPSFSFIWYLLRLLVFTSDGWQCLDQDLERTLILFTISEFHSPSHVWVYPEDGTWISFTLCYLFLFGCMSPPALGNFWQEISDWELCCQF